MPRPYSQKFLMELQNGDPDSLGIQLGRLCVDCNIPAAYVAKALNTSRITVYSWFRGASVREKKRREILTFMDLVRADAAQGYLPAKNVTDAKRYIEGMIGVEI
jgi:hypothetical protein